MARYDYWATVTVLKRAFGLQKKTLEGRGVKSRKNDSDATEYHLQQAIQKCGDLISKRLNTSPDQAAELSEAANQKGMEELRKLRLENAVRSGEAVPVADIIASIGQSVRAMTDRLDAITTKVRMGVADIQPDQLAAINQAIIAKRNEAAGQRREAEHENQ